MSTPKQVLIIDYSEFISKPLSMHSIIPAGDEEFTFIDSNLLSDIRTDPESLYESILFE